MFGQPQSAPQDEATPLRPRGAYAVAKAFAHNLVVSYRQDFGLHASSAILYNHESPRRRDVFVTRKISLGVARIKLGLQQSLVLGDLDARRDRGFAGDYVHAMWLMAQQEHADDYVIGTGETHSVRELCEIAFSAVGLIDWKRFVKTDRSLERRDEASRVVANVTKARRMLGWKPSISFVELIRLMVEHDLKEQGGLLGGDCQPLS